jgi:cysteine desulfurase
MARVEPMRNNLADRLISELPDVRQVGDTANRLPNTLSVHFSGTDAEAIMANCPNISMSTGSACSAGAIEPSAVLTAMGFDRDEAFEVLRITLGRFTTEPEIQKAADSIVTAVKYVRSLTQRERSDATI